MNREDYQKGYDEAKADVDSARKQGQEEGYEKGVKYAEAIHNAAKVSNLDQLKQHYKSIGKSQAYEEIYAIIKDEKSRGYEPRTILQGLEAHLAFPQLTPKEE